jgi:hypothetical protein
MQKEARKHIEPLPWRSPPGHVAGVAEIADGRRCIERVVAAAKDGGPAYTTRPENASIQEITDPTHGRWGHAVHLMLFLNDSYGVEVVDSHNVIMFGVTGMQEKDASKLKRYVDSDISATGRMEDYVRETYYGEDACVSWEKAAKLPEKIESGEAPLADGTKRDLSALRKSLISKRLRATK